MFANGAGAGGSCDSWGLSELERCRGAGAGESAGASAVFDAGETEEGG